MLKSIETVLAPLDAKLLERERVWVTERYAALRTFESENLCLRRSNVWEYYAQVWSICGGKGMYQNVFSGRNVAGAVEVAEKHLISANKKRNHKIMAKLEGAGANEIETLDSVLSEDGFHGMFLFQTDDGQKNVSIDTIIAGGYNIQRLHQRTLVKIM